MERRTFLKLAAAGAATSALAAPTLAQAPVTIRWWYHFDNPQNTPAALVAKFEAANPGIKVLAEAIPWGGGNDYATRLFASVVAGNAPDCAQVKLNNHARLLEMDALAPLDDMLKGWAGRSDIAENVWALNKAKDGKTYYLPLHYVVLYLYYRADLLAAAGVQPPKTPDDFLAAAKATTKGDVVGFGMRGGGGGQDNWGAFVLGGGASFAKGGMVSEKALAANRWYVDLHKTHKVTAASAPTDGFRQIVDGFKAGRSAMIIHHIGSSNDMVQALKVLKVLVLKEYKDLKALKALKVLDHKALKALKVLDHKALKVLKVLDHKALKVLKVLKGLALALKVLRVLKVILVLKVLVLVPKVLKVLRVLKVPKELALKVYKEIKEVKVLKVILVLKVLVLVPKVLKVLKVLKALKALKVFKVLKAHKALKVLEVKVLKVLRDLELELKVLKVLLVHQVVMVPKVLLVHQVVRVPKVLLVLTELMVQMELKVLKVLQVL